MVWPAMVVYRSTTYRIYPTAEQVERMVAWQTALRWLWNLAVEQRLLGLARPRDERIYVRYLDQQAQLTDLRAELPWLADVPVQACQGILRDLDKAWERCVKKLCGRPRWKCNSGPQLTIFCGAHRKFTVSADAVTFPKLGAIRAVIHREPVGKPKTIQIQRDVDQWFAVVMCEVDVPEPARHPGLAVGIDRGVVNVIADSDGRIVENQSRTDAGTFATRLARAQRTVARKVDEAKAEGRKPDGANIRKARERVAKLHRKVRRQRDHVLHVESKRYAERYGTIVVEKLDVKGMSSSAKGTVEAPGRNVRQKAGLNRGILSAGWSHFVNRLRYKTEERGGRVVEVPAAYTSQTCSHCGHVAAENRPTQAQFECQACGVVEHADVNAAKNILARGLAGHVAAPKAPKKALRTLKRARKSSATVAPTTAVPAVEACGGDLHVMGPVEAGTPRSKAATPQDLAPVRTGTNRTLVTLWRLCWRRWVEPSRRLLRLAREAGPDGTVHVMAADIAALWGYTAPSVEA